MNWASLLLSILVLTFPFSEQEPIEGVYYASERIISSELRIKPKNRFEYFYRLGGCQSTVYGNWELSGKKIILIADDEYLKDSNEEYTPIYPRFENFEWKIKRNGLTPNQEIDTGCFKIKKVHRKVK